MDRVGIVEFLGPETLRANQLFSAEIRVLPAMAVEPGGRIVLAARHMSDIGDPQWDDPAAENFIDVLSPPGVEWTLMPANSWGRHPWNRGIELKLTQGCLKPGDELRVRLGPEGSVGYRCQSFSEEAFRLRLGIAPNASDRWLLADDDVTFCRIAGNAAAALRVTVADVNGDRRRIHIKPEDAYGNIASTSPDRVDLWLDDHRFLHAVDLPGDSAVEVDVDLPVDGRHRLTASSPDGSFFGRSNPFGPSTVDGLNLYWGEIHAQSGLCDGTNSPACLYDYARNAAGLDFAAVTSHDFELTPQNWAEIVEATSAAHVPGEFVSFLGYEWSGERNRGGDHNVYFRGDEGPLIYNGPWGGLPGWDPAEGHVTETIDITETIRRFKDLDVMVIPHGGGRTCNLDFFDSQHMPLLEVHSCHRSYDFIARDAIERGLRVGFIGGSDDHRGAIGDSHVCARDRFFSSHNGLAAVYAESLTRDALWDAFQQRRTYATNGARMILDVRVNDTFMGGELQAEAGQPLKLRMRAWFDGMLDRIEVLQGVDVIRELSGSHNQHDAFEDSIEFTAQPGDTAYWIRVFQTDGGKAWTSPVWVQCPK